ncbi:hypothetical protein [Chryseobacterium sp.]|uniref:hypothetical protein n=1 Tax=Chryseobacterium sp. TaxID=1871047 RepID=UPI00289D222C|nr:hypothetical protein [Chryseobacterium sp.]
MRNSTIQNKKGVCIDCPPGSPEKPLIAKRCSTHYWNYRASLKPVKVKDIGKPIPKKSAKRKKEDPIYTRERLRFLAQPENLRCFIEGCNKSADTVEHTMGRKGFADQWARDNNISLYLDVRFWKPCCNEHNLELERNPELSQKYQLSKISGNAKIQKTN